MESTSAPTLRNLAASAAIVLLGYLAPLYALPIYSRHHPEARCAYSLVVLVVWTVMQVLPVPVACIFPPIVLAASDTIGEDDVIAGYTSPYVLHVVAVMLIIQLAHSLSLFDRAAMVVIRSQGARVRSLVVGFAVLSLLVTLFLDNGVTTMLMAALIERATRALQDDTIQTQQKKALFNKATRRFSRHRRKTLEDLLLKDTEQTGHPSSLGAASPLSVRQPGSPTSAASEYDVEALSDIREQPVKQYASPPQMSRIARKTSFQSASKVAPGTNSQSRKQGNNAQPRRISIIDRGHVVLPGISSPTPPKNRAQSITTASFGATGARRMTLMTTALDTVGLKELASWEKERCSAIQRDLLQGAVMVAVIGSIVSTRGNMANVFLFSYLRMRFARVAALHVTSWVAIVFPVVGCGLLACFSIMYFDLVRHYDAEEDENTRLEILKVIEKQSEGLGALTSTERFVLALSVVVAGLWVLINGALSFAGGGRFVGLSEQQLVMLDYMLVAFLSSTAAGWSGGSVGRAAPSSAASSVDWRSLASYMQWGPLVIQGSLSCLSRAVQLSGVTFWIQSLFNEFRPFAPTTIQIVLTVLSSVLTEFVSIDVTVTTLLPIVVDLALKIQCNPLYFAIPVTVASSTTLILPTASMPIAILDDVFTLSRRKMLIHGAVVKVVTLTSLIFSMNTLGDSLFSWSELPNWAQQLSSAPNASSVTAAPRFFGSSERPLPNSFRRG